MKKLGLIILVFLVALGSLGVAYSRWSRTLTTTENVSTGTFGCQFQQAISNDDGNPGNVLDPSAQGSWSWTSGTLTASNWSGSRSSGNIASTTVSGAITQTLTIKMSTTYVGYWSSIGCTIKNTGTVPMKVSTVTATVTPPTGRSASDVSVSFTGALVANTQIAAGSEVLGAIYIVWNSVPSTSSTYGLTVTISNTQAVP
jgi:hypothetical protein